MESRRVCLLLPDFGRRLADLPYLVDDLRGKVRVEAVVEHRAVRDGLEVSETGVGWHLSMIPVIR